jgi:uncharacterized protein (DUF169 family)
MDMALKEKFLSLWEKYFNGAELPITFYYSDQEKGAEAVKTPTGHLCAIGVLAKVRKGTSLCFEAASVGCLGGKKYFGFSQEIMPDFEYFLSCGIPGKLEGERYLKSPKLVRELVAILPKWNAPAKLIVFKRWDKLQERDEPDVVIFFSRPDVLSGLFTLANYDEAEPNSVFAPFSSGCGSIVQYPYLQKVADRPRAVLGMFDVSARPFVPKEVLTLAVPMNKFAAMVGNMEESFLITPSWSQVKKRIA